MSWVLGVSKNLQVLQLSSEWWLGVLVDASIVEGQSFGCISSCTLYQIQNVSLKVKFMCGSIQTSPQFLSQILLTFFAGFRIHCKYCRLSSYQSKSHPKTTTQVPNKFNLQVTIGRYASKAKEFYQVKFEQQPTMVKYLIPTRILWCSRFKERVLYTNFPTFLSMFQLLMLCKSVWLADRQCRLSKQGLVWFAS